MHNRRVKFGLKIPNRLGKSGTKPQGGFFLTHTVLYGILSGQPFCSRNTSDNLTFLLTKRTMNERVVIDAGIVVAFLHLFFILHSASSHRSRLSRRHWQTGLCSIVPRHKGSPSATCYKGTCRWTAWVVHPLTLQTAHFRL